MKSPVFYLLLLLQCSLSIAQNKPYLFDHYKVHLNITDTTITASTRFYLKESKSESDTINTNITFELNKAYNDITVSEKFNLTQPGNKNAITINCASQPAHIDFSYTASLDSLGIAHPNTQSYTFLDKDVIPLIHSKDVFRPFTYEITYNNQNSAYQQLFSNANQLQKNTLQSSQPTDRLILHLSKNALPRYHYKDFTIYADEEIATDSLTFIVNKTTKIMSFYNDYFVESKKQMNDLTLFINDSFKNSFFSRKNFICVNKSDSERKTQYLLAHELGHYWCSTADVFNYIPDAFLNESLAEYMSIIWYREQFGQERFESIIERNQNRIRNLNVSIMDISKETMKSGEAQRSLLYIKGALVCYQLEQKLGKEKFKSLLSTIVRLKISSLIALEQLLQNKYGKDIADFFHGLISNRLRFTE